MRRPTLRAEGRPGPAGAQEQVLEEEALAAAENAGEGGEEEPEEFDHRAGWPIAATSRAGAQTFAPLHEQRTRILGAARRVFARSGVGATMADVVLEAGVSQGLAYRYFESKDELFRALVEQASQSLDWGYLVKVPGTPTNRLRSLLSELLQARRDQPELFELGNHVLNDKTTPPDLLELVATRGRGFETVLRELIIEGQEAGEFASDDPDQLVTAVTACLDGLSRFALRPRDKGHKKFPHTEVLMRMLQDPRGPRARSKQ